MRVECDNENLLVIEEDNLLMMANLQRGQEVPRHLTIPGHSILKQRTVFYFAERYNVPICASDVIVGILIPV